MTKTSIGLSMDTKNKMKEYKVINGESFESLILRKLNSIDVSKLTIKTLDNHKLCSDETYDSVVIRMIQGFEEYESLKNPE